jgi:hypothetical protein
MRLAFLGAVADIAIDIEFIDAQSPGRNGHRCSRARIESLM